MNKSTRVRWTMIVARVGDIRNAFRILVKKLKGKRPLGRTRRRCVENIKIYLRMDGDGLD
jgi:hypothetical protein